MKKIIVAILIISAIFCSKKDISIVTIAQNETEKLYSVMMLDQGYKKDLTEIDKTINDAKIGIMVKTIYVSHYIGYKLHELGVDNYKQWLEENLK